MDDLWADKAKEVISDLKSSNLRKPKLARSPKRFAEGGEAGGQQQNDGQFWNQLARWVYTGEGAPNYAAGGEVEQPESDAYARGGASPDDVELQKRMKAVLREDEQDPERAAAYMKARESYQMPTHERGAYSERVLPMAAHDVDPTISDLPGVSTKAPTPFSWNKF